MKKSMSLGVRSRRHTLFCGGPEIDSRTPRFALYCLLTQTVRSLMACEKSADAPLAPPRYAWQQMSASQPLVFLCAH